MIASLLAYLEVFKQFLGNLLLVRKIKILGLKSSLFFAQISKIFIRNEQPVDNLNAPRIYKSKDPGNFLESIVIKGD